ncbi:MAG: hypothetical protein AB8G05_12640 [Oligoflexales bacterium]
MDKENKVDLSENIDESQKAQSSPESSNQESMSQVREQKPESTGLKHQQKEENTLTISLSKALYKKLKSKASVEGVSPQDLASELLAEGLVLRAWEIMERKSTMRQSSNGGNYNQGGNRSGHKQSYRNGSQNGYNRGRSSNHNNSNYSNSNNNSGQNRRGNYQHILEDSANFLEYVRNQEKKNNT